MRGLALTVAVAIIGILAGYIMTPARQERPDTVIHWSAESGWPKLQDRLLPEGWRPGAV